MAIYLINTSNGPVDLTTLPTATTDYGVCDCGAELSPLIGDNGEVRTTFCEYCD
ncbi:hypothetical protein OOK58_42585 [Streptomyces sp. NBC_01728]|uniref:hypothetical protein n=1 Tax=Streptomyces TaxID=1883 RepID=UPI0022534369|nr:MULTISPECIES: hypothetical protein [Streptomyces]MCX4458600.1 hypothetical protein [Streptomyces sp. NBC_01719]MCX4497957.1 hypothetical protein [Streptomyces sp. NBC_01728]MCX4609421.1 hypothetical protein [Streptomyces mirabilis]